mmetsp:Transcript_5804/g.6303  ORF Transcript_5804/g.6303 Transcript_5804/m.6303 type:complete len:159 (+) Transcript_5804:74-550(+)
MEAIQRKVLTKLDAESARLMDYITKLIHDYTDDATAQKFRKSVYAIFFRVVLLYKQNQINKDDFLTLKYSFRYMCSSTTNYFRYNKVETQSIERITKWIAKFKADLIGVLVKYDEKLCDKITDTMRCVEEKEFLQFAITREDFKEVVYVFLGYLDRTR